MLRPDSTRVKRTSNTFALAISQAINFQLILPLQVVFSPLISGAFVQFLAHRFSWGASLSKWPLILDTMERAQLEDLVPVDILEAGGLKLKVGDGG